MPKPNRFPMPIPFGWFFVHFSADLNIGDVKTLHYVGQELVLFRTEEGQPALLDAYCPHQGAHLGFGGEVAGDAIRCPFHGWEYKTDGWCKHIPYATQMPPKCKEGPVIQSYPVVEKNGVVWAWYHPEGAAPWFEVMEHEEFTQPGWCKPYVRDWRFASNPQEIAENGVDVAHFRFVHKMNAVPEGHTEYEGHIRRSAADGLSNHTLPDGTVKEIKRSIRTVQNGAGQKYTRITGVVDLAMMVLATPVEADDVELRFVFAWPDAPEDSPQYQAALAAAKITSGPDQGVENDLPIWQNKIYRSKPILCDGDGPVYRFRKYFEQFYVGYKMDAANIKF